MTPVDTARVVIAIADLLEALDLPEPWHESEELRQTPARVARFFKEFIDWDPGTLDTTFDPVRADEMVIVRGIEVWSLCAHHVLPMRISASVGYIPGEEGELIGLSKVARIVQKHAHRLQMQERFVRDIAEELQEIIKPEGVGVVARGRHCCMAMRGIRTPGEMITSVVLGNFRSMEVKSEFLKLIGD